MWLVHCRTCGRLWGPSGVPPTNVPYAFPHGLALGFPGLALNDKMVTGLLLISIAPPAFVRGGLVDFIAELADSIGPPGFSSRVG